MSPCILLSYNPEEKYLLRQNGSLWKETFFDPNLTSKILNSTSFDFFSIYVKDTVLKFLLYSNNFRTNKLIPC